MSLLPEFLPFFMQSDLFMNRAVEISVGSLSPTINWKTLAMQEFALPPMEEQRRIVELLAALEVQIEMHCSAFDAASYAAKVSSCTTSSIEQAETSNIAKLFGTVGQSITADRTVSIESCGYSAMANVLCEREVKT